MLLRALPPVVALSLLLAGGADALKPQRSKTESGPAIAAKPKQPTKATKPTVGLTEEAEAGIAQAERLLQAALSKPASLKPHLADRHAVEGYVWSTGINKADEARMIAGVLEEQKASAPPPTPPFVPDTCFSAAALGANERVVLTTEEMVFFEGASRSATMFWVQVQPDRRTLLLGPPVVDAAREGALERWQDKVRQGDATMYRKKGTTWAAVSPPAKAAPTCEEQLKLTAKQLAVAELSYRGENDVFTSDLAAAGFAAPVGVTATVKLATDTAFVAELTLKGGVVTIDDQLAITVLTPCAP